MGAIVPESSLFGDLTQAAGINSVRARFFGSEGGERNQGDFWDGAWVQEVIIAVELSVHERRWIELPLDIRSGAQT